MMDFSQVTLTVYRLPKIHWRKQPIWFYRFSFKGMWALVFRVLWFGVELHNNSVWAFEDEMPRKARGLP